MATRWGSSSARSRGSSTDASGLKGAKLAERTIEAKRIELEEALFTLERRALDMLK